MGNQDKEKKAPKSEQLRGQGRNQWRSDGLSRWRPHLANGYLIQSTNSKDYQLRRETKSKSLPNLKPRSTVRWSPGGNRPLKKQLGVTLKVVHETKESLELTQMEHSDLAERVTMCETEQSAQWNEITDQSIYNRRWNLCDYFIRNNCIHSHNTRNSNDLYLPAPKLSLGKKHF